MSTNYSFPVKIIGVGNEFRGDDGIGLFVCRELKQRLPDEICIIEAPREGTKLIQLWQDTPAVIVVDAVNSGSNPGKIFRFDATHEPLDVERYFGCSSHGIGLAETIELARSLDQLPERLIIFGIEGKDFEQHESLSKDVMPSVARVASEIVKELTKMHSR